MAIRCATKEDIPHILAIYAPYVENTCFSFEYTVPTIEEFTNRFETITAQFPWLVWEEDGVILGYAYGSAPFYRTAYRWCAEASIYLHPNAQGRGIGKQLYTTLEDILRQQGYCVLYAIITTNNQGSVAFHEKLGYHCRAIFPDCGFKHDSWHGTIWMEKKLNSTEKPTIFPIPASDIVKTYRF